jgi:hypothetical protein
VRVDQQSPQAPDHPAPGLITQRPRFVKKVYNGMVAKDPLGKIIVITADLKAQRERRDNLIKEALAEGYSLRDVAEAAELSHTAIAKIRDRQLS